ncbi:Cytochrome P450 78A11 [Nymphaea thermarum]|nr:Cytochrome P450 78A11 [Nymphaea thermarum]
MKLKENETGRDAPEYQTTQRHTSSPSAVADDQKSVRATLKFKGYRPLPSKGVETVDAMNEGIPEPGKFFKRGSAEARHRRPHAGCSQTNSSGVTAWKIGRRQLHSGAQEPAHRRQPPRPQCGIASSHLFAPERVAAHEPGRQADASATLGAISSC